jgi:hypothetical protein
MKSFSLNNLATKIKFREQIVHILFDINFELDDDFYDIEIPKSYINIDDQIIPTNVYYDEPEEDILKKALSHYIDDSLQDKTDLTPKKIGHFLNLNGIKEYTIVKKDNKELKESKAYSEPLVSYFKTIYKHHGGRKSSIASILANSLVESSNRYFEDNINDSNKLIDMIIERLNQLKG